MNINELGAWIQVNQTPGIGPRKFLKILSLGINPKEIIANPQSYQKILALNEKSIQFLNQKNIPQIKLAKQWLDPSENRHILTITDKQYPSILKQINDPPIILYVHGNTDILHKPQLAMVGTRASTAYGRSNAKKFAAELTMKDFVITSGLALGIDSISHKSALDNGGKTIAVMGTGINNIYPEQNQDLALEIKKNGALVSELPLNSHPTRANFPKRNRIISGLSYGTLVVESALKSGSLITAKHALEQNREVFAIPGNIYANASSGCHKLIQQGAKLVSNIDDILNELPSYQPKTTDNFIPITAHPNSEPKLNSIEEMDNKRDLLTPLGSLQQLLSFIDYQNTAVDSIIERSGLAANKITIDLFELELTGKIEAIPGGYRRI